MYRLRVLFDAGSGVWLWADDDACDRVGYPILLDDLPLSSSTRADGERLITRFDTSLGPDDPVGPSPGSAADTQAFDAAVAVWLGDARRKLGAGFDNVDASQTARPPEPAVTPAQRGETGEAASVAASPRALVVGAGPAGLMAADVLSEAGCSVTVADQMPSPGRKLLMAGKSGLNLTNQNDAFGDAYGWVSAEFAAAIEAFGPEQVVEWASRLGQDVFVGSTGRVFPVAMKASPLLRAWLGRLAGQGVTLHTRWRWAGRRAGRDVFDTPDGPRALAADVTVLALGGASWRRLGSDGAWAEQFAGSVAPFRPANVGLRVDWTRHMARWHGAPLKGVAFTAAELTSRGEAVITAHGLEGGGVYSVSRALREGAALTVDLVPDLAHETVAERLARQDPKASLATRLRKALRLEGVRAALLHEFGRPLGADLARTIKALPVRHSGVMPLDDAISTAGGLHFDALEGFRLRGHRGVYAAGEMLDWEAPTGGWLLTGCLATGRAAARQALADLGVTTGTSSG